MQKKFIKLLKKLRRRYIERHGLPQHSPLNKARTNREQRQSRKPHPQPLAQALQQTS